METYSSEAVLILTPYSYSPESVDVTSISDQDNTVSKWEISAHPVRSPDVSWTDSPKKIISLYSENIVQEKETTEEVDRESIANLATTRKQWETVLLPLVEKSETPPKTKQTSTVKHWEVRFPNKSPPKPVESFVKQSKEEFNMADTDPYANESAINREIRLAREREEMLRMEQEERQKLLENQKGIVITKTFERNTKEESFKPNFHEMTEADRGSEMSKRESLIQQELWEQEERERALNKNKQIEVQTSEETYNNESTVESTESIIQREIRLQREREEELAQQRNRNSRVIPEPAKPEAQPSPTHSEASSKSIQNDINHNNRKDISYEEAISDHHHEGENLIARELRELREREEELQQQRKFLQRAENEGVTPDKVKTASTSQTKTTPTVTPIVKQGTWQKDVSPYLEQSRRRGSGDSLTSSHSTGKSPSDVAFEPKAETPIEREIRLAGERENEHRRLKGLPEKPLPEPKIRHREAEPTAVTHSGISPRYRSEPEKSTMRRFASSRLQQEIIAQKQREVALQNEGKIITTSEEHIEPMKYVSVTGQEKASGNVKRNFVTRRSGMSPYSQGEEENLSDTSSNTSVTTTPQKQELVLPKRISVSAGGGASFSYRETRQTAESKIERELREMREREDELRKQRSHSGQLEEISETPSSPRETTANGQAEQVPTGRGHLAAQWEQICNN